MKRLLILSIISLVPVAGCASQSTSDTTSIYFKRVTEPNEKAFSVLAPQDWHTKGGIFRLDPSTSGGAGNAIAAKYDFSVFNNPDADVQIRWLPDYLFMDMRNVPAGPMFPPGSNYNGMEVRYKTDPVSFIMQVVIPYAHPNISNLKLTGQKPLPGLAKVYREFAAKNPMLTMVYSAGMVNMEYSESGKEYEEILIAVIEDYGQLGAGLWGNKGCVLIRAPKGELKKWASVLATIHGSVKIDIAWLKGEMRGQQTRGTTLINVQKQMQNIDREIAAHQQKTNYEIQNNMYLTLTDQEEYVNPYSGEIEIGANQWNHRWQNDLGEIIYTDQESYNPNYDPELNVSGFRRSLIRKR